jgi:hypothetical protein
MINPSHLLLKTKSLLIPTITFCFAIFLGACSSGWTPVPYSPTIEVDEPSTGLVPDATAVDLSELVESSPTPQTAATSPSETHIDPTEEQPPPTATETQVADGQGASLPAEHGAFFSTAGTCIPCHADMLDESGQDVSNGEFWRSTMMANAARDPYWQATMRAEVSRHPSYQAVIEDKCTTCHTPMARFTDAAGGESGSFLDSGYRSEEHGLHTLAMEGVSCTLCHQVQPDLLGEEDSFSGGYVVDVESLGGGRELFGPYITPGDQAQIMKAVSGYIPIQGLHIQKSELCAACHTLYTPTIDENGEISGLFPEQTPYLEWLNSAYKDSASCQDCHMPIAQGGVQLSLTGGELRGPFNKHEFVGGNVYMSYLLKSYINELGLTASSEHVDATLSRTLDQLQNRAGAVRVENLAIEATSLTADVLVSSEVGHKFPTGYPSRRLWLHFVVQDAGGEIIFESGAFDLDGSIPDNANDANPEAFEPHYTFIDTPGEVQIYETIMMDTRGRVTTALMRGAGYLKDNRLLPLGFDLASAGDEIQPYGGAQNDPDFQAGEDRIQYVIDIGGAQGPFKISVDLLYQSISFRWMENLRPSSAAEIDRFLGYAEAIPNLPVVISGAIIEVGD